MTTTTSPTITESDLLSDAEFLKWCAAWEAEKRCPLPMVDWILEKYDDERMYLAARWAWGKSIKGQHIFPGPLYTWIDIRSEEYGPWNIPLGFTTHLPNLTMMGIPAAIAFYFIHFNAELAAKYPPKDEVYP